MMYSISCNSFWWYLMITGKIICSYKPWCFYWFVSVSCLILPITISFLYCIWILIIVFLGIEILKVNTVWLISYTQSIYDKLLIWIFFIRKYNWEAILEQVTKGFTKNYCIVSSFTPAKTYHNFVQAKITVIAGVYELSLSNFTNVVDFSNSSCHFLLIFYFLV